MLGCFYLSLCPSDSLLSSGWGSDDIGFKNTHCSNMVIAISQCVTITCFPLCDDNNGNGKLFKWGQNVCNKTEKGFWHIALGGGYFDCPEPVNYCTIHCSHHVVQSKKICFTDRSLRLAKQSVKYPCQSCLTHWRRHWRQCLCVSEVQPQ